MTTFREHTSGPVTSVLFVCLGNICRSPAAEGVMLSLLQRHGLAALVRVDSAGTSGHHIGELADARMRRAALARGVQLTSRSRAICLQDLFDFDLVVVMDRDNYREVSSLGEGPTSKVRLLSDYLDERWPLDVPDPYYGGEDGFEQVLDMLEAACPQLLLELTGVIVGPGSESKQGEGIADGDAPLKTAPSVGKPGSNDLLHGITLEMMLQYLVENHGWEEMGLQIPIRCFQFNPSIKSSLKFLRQTPWARKRVEDWYLYDARRFGTSAE